MEHYTTRTNYGEATEGGDGGASSPNHYEPILEREGG